MTSILELLILIAVFHHENYYARIVQKLKNVPRTHRSYLTEMDSIYACNDFYSDAVFFGNSIVHSADWNELLGINVSNQGFPGDGIQDMINRVGNVRQERPKIIVLMAGVNDIKRGNTAEEVYAAYLGLVDSLDAIQSNLIVNSTLPISVRIFGSDYINEEIYKLNTLLQDYCTNNDIEYLNIYQYISMNNGLCDDYTTDGIHLSPVAYALWADLLLRVLSDFEL